MIQPNTLFSVQTFSNSGLWEFRVGPVELFIHVFPGSGPSAVRGTNQPQDKGSLTTDLLACRVIICHLIVPTDFWDPSIPRRQPAAGAKSFSKINRRKK